MTCSCMSVCAGMVSHYYMIECFRHAPSYVYLTGKHICLSCLRERELEFLVASTNSMCAYIYCFSLLGS